MTIETTDPDPSRRALTARGLTLGYPGVDVVCGADITLEPGRVTALIGPNGSGKSTVLRALTRLHAPREGEIFLADGTDVLGLGRKALARRITLLAQGRPTPGGVSVRDVVGFGRHPYRGRWRGADADGAEIVARAMAVTGVDDLADRGIEQLSGGQLQRVWLAGCLAQNTGILLLDEPTTYLDLRYQVELLDLIRDLADVHGVTVGVVLHDLDQAAAIADSLVLLAEGHVVAAGAASDVLEAGLLSEAYGIPIHVDTDPTTGALRTRAIGRHHLRTERITTPS